jgi:molybdopterin adenylyltransferase
MDLVTEILIGILTVSDRASRGEYEDRGGPAVETYLKRKIVSPYGVLRRIVSDDLEVVRRELRRMADDESCSLIVTTGGTGPSPRDCTPDATLEVCEKILPGFGEQMRRVSARHVPTALLSRQTAGFRGRCLMINLPGNPRAIQECLDAVFAAVPHCIELIGGPRLLLETPPDLPH